MLKRLAKWRRGRRRNRRQDDFAEAIERYRSAVLAPLGLDPDEWEPRDHVKNRRIFLGEGKVWKFFRPTLKHNALNFQAASKTLAGEGLAVPSILHGPDGADDVARHGLACLVMTRIEGRELSRELDGAEQERLGRFLARMHQVRSPRWGDCHHAESGDYVEGYFFTEIEKRIGRVNAWLAERGREPLYDLTGWFDRRRSDLAPLADGFCMVSSDAHPNNFMRLPDGEIAMIDLDRSRYLDFPLDLTYLLHHAAVQGGGLPLSETPEDFACALETALPALMDAYFGDAPASYREHWLQARAAFHMFVLLRSIGGLAKPGRLDHKNETEEELSARFDARFEVLQAMAPALTVSGYE